MARNRERQTITLAPIAWTPESFSLYHWGRWLLVSLFALLTGCSIGFDVISSLSRAAWYLDIGLSKWLSPSDHFVRGVGGLVGGGWVAVIVAAYFRRYDDIHFPLAPTWLLTNAGSMALAMIVTIAINLRIPDDQFHHHLLTTAIGSSLIGVSQWLYLRRQVPRATWWIPVVVLSGLVLESIFTVLLLLIRCC